MFQRILETIDEGIHAVDATGRTIFYNSKAAAHDGLDPKEVIGKHILEVFPSLTPKTSTLISVINSKNPIYDLQQSYVNMNGEKIETVNSTLPIINDQKLIGAVEVAKDYSKIKRLSEKLVDLQANMSNQNIIHKTESASYEFKDILTINRLFLKTIQLGEKIAQYESNVLVYGETGTGKELYVQAIHNRSRRSAHSFIAQNCAAIPENLLESLLFGSSKGSYTGAVERAGLFEVANHGTLFLDELQSMPVSLQAKILRVIEDGVVRRVGDLKGRKVDVRLIAAMNEPPEVCVKKGLLREDLFYRLNVFSINLLPLRKRKDDIDVLIKHFIGHYNSLFNKEVAGIQQDALESLQRYDWPGNVRELKHAIEYSMNMSEDNDIELSHLPPKFQKNSVSGRGNPFSLPQKIQEIEKNFIEDALQKNQFNVLKAAQTLNIPRQTLQYKIKKLKIAENSAARK
ncbi:sigma-54 interaction domain-containing protein [Metabacillus arenae]